MIKAIIFDCYGVLVTDGWLPFKSEQFGHSSELMDEAGNINSQYNKDFINYAEFIQSLADLANMPSLQVMQAVEGNKVNKKLFKQINEFKKLYKIGLLSNIGHNILEGMFNERQLDVFDAMALSFETGYVKPDPRAYEIIAERLGVDTEECVMIDDVERNCTAAEEAGMKSVWYKEFNQAVTDLNKILN